MAIDSQVESQIIAGAKNPEIGAAEVKVARAIDSVYGYKTRRSDLGQNIGDNEVALRDGLANIVESFRDVALANDWWGTYHDQQISADILQNATDELRGKRAASENLIKIVRGVSELAREYEIADHMDELRMPDGRLGRFFYHLQFDDSDRRKSQLAYIAGVEKYVVDHAPKWAEEVKSKRQF